MQGPFRGVGGQLARAFGGTVTLFAGTAQARDVRAIFRQEPRRVELPGGAQAEMLVPVLRGPRDALGSLVEGDRIDPKDGAQYRFLFFEESEAPASDALITAKCEMIE